jgi:hypothetical protein
MRPNINKTSPSSEIEAPFHYLNMKMNKLEVSFINFDFLSQKRDKNNELKFNFTIFLFKRKISV